MQAEMLDSIVSSHSQELFNFNAEHNGEACIESLRPEDAHTPNAFRFTIAMLCAIYNVAERTMRDNIDSLLEDEEIAYCDISQYAISGGNNRTYETSLYNLNVLNRLGMCCFRKNKEAKRVRDKFNDVLVNHETQTQPTIFDYARALLAEKERSDALEAQNKALTAERDEAIRTRARIGSRREAKAMNTASQKSKECKRLETENCLLKQDFVTNADFCSQLLAQNLVVYAESTLKAKCSKALQELTALMEKKTLNWKEWNDKAGKEVPRVAYHKDVCAELKQRILDNPKYLKRF